MTGVDTKYQTEKRNSSEYTKTYDLVKPLNHFVTTI